MLAVKDVYCLGADQKIPKHDAVKQKEIGLSCTGSDYDGNKIAEKHHAINFKQGTIRFCVSGFVSSTAFV